MVDSNVADVVGDLREAIEMTNETDQISINFDVVVSVFNATAGVVDDETPLNENTMVRVPFQLHVVTSF